MERKGMNVGEKRKEISKKETKEEKDRSKIEEG